MLELSEFSTAATFDQCSWGCQRRVQAMSDALAWLRPSRRRLLEDARVTKKEVEDGNRTLRRITTSARWARPLVFVHKCVLQLAGVVILFVQARVVGRVGWDQLEW